VPAARVAFGLLLLLGALGVAVVAVVEVARGTRYARWRAGAAVVEAAGVGVVALGLLAHRRPLVVLGVVVLAVGALWMSVARRGSARRPH
jgi:hypothetical protein